MDVFSPHEFYWIAGSVTYVLLLLMSYIWAYRWDKYGIRTTAKILSSGASNTNYDYGGEVTSTDHEVSIEFQLENKEMLRTTIPIEGRFLRDKSNTHLPIIYKKHKPENALVDNTLKIYQAPIALGIVLLVCVLCILGASYFSS